MTDIVERLLSPQFADVAEKYLMVEAAAEIRRLRTALAEEKARYPDAYIMEAEAQIERLRAENKRLDNGYQIERQHRAAVEDENERLRTQLQMSYPEHCEERDKLRAALKKIAEGQWRELDGTIVRTKEAGIALAALEGE